VQLGAAADVSAVPLNDDGDLQRRYSGGSLLDPGGIRGPGSDEVEVSRSGSFEIPESDGTGLPARGATS
jgi:hypothetical protein